MKVLCIIQARMNSTRLPGKVILPFAGSSIIECIYKRVKRSKRVNEVVVGTSAESSDDILTKLLEEKYKLDSKIEEYERKTNKITENMSSNDTLLESQTTKTMLLKNINIGVLIFVIISLLYINFKPFVTRKRKMMQLKKKEDNLFSSNNDKIMTENINNENKMM